MSWINEQSGNYTIQPQDNNQTVIFNSSSTVTCTLPEPSTARWMDSFFRVSITNVGSGVLVLSPTSATIDGEAALSLDQFQGTQLTSDGANYFTVRGIGTSGGGSLVLETNGTANGSQSLFNLAAGSNVTLTDNGSGTVTVSSSGGSGAVTSVALTVPSRQAVTGSPITSSGTLAITDNNQSANEVFAGPPSGSATTPAFRVLVPSDLPVATASAFGAVRPDNSTITVSSGVISASSASVYYGQGSATASAGDNLITLGSVPISGSVTIFVTGAPLPPGTSAYSVSGATILLATSLTSGQQVIVSWVTTNSVPGGIALSEQPAQLRGTSSATSSATSATVSLPSGTQVGDLAILFVGSGNASSAPSGWTTLQNQGSQSWWTGAVFSKTLNSTDISTGSVTVSLSPSGAALVIQIATFIGATGGVRETNIGYVSSTSPATFSTTTSGSVVNSDGALIFGSLRGNACPTVSVGTVEQSQADSSNQAAGALYFLSPATAGGFTATVSYSGYNPEGFYQAIVVVKA